MAEKQILICDKCKVKMEEEKNDIRCRLRKGEQKYT